MDRMTPRSQAVDFGILLGLAYQQFVVELRTAHAAAGFDTGRSDGYVFRALARGPLTISDLAKRLNITKQAAGQIVDDMQRRGFVERGADPHDARARPVRLSARGREALAAARRFHRQFEQRLVRAHGREAVGALRDLLTAIAGGADQVRDPSIRALYL
jgi:DNA-binding MarR family transcriptional regulator